MLGKCTVLQQPAPNSPTIRRSCSEKCLGRPCPALHLCVLSGHAGGRLAGAGQRLLGSCLWVRWLRLLPAAVQSRRTAGTHMVFAAKRSVCTAWPGASSSLHETRCQGWRRKGYCRVPPFIHRPSPSPCSLLHGKRQHQRDQADREHGPGQGIHIPAVLCIVVLQAADGSPACTAVTASSAWTVPAGMHTRLHPKAKLVGWARRRCGQGELEWFCARVEPTKRHDASLWA